MSGPVLDSVYLSAAAVLRGEIAQGARVVVWTGEAGRIVHRNADGSYVVQLDGERVQHTWLAAQVEPIACVCGDTGSVDEDDRCSSCAGAEWRERFLDGLESMREHFSDLGAL